MILNWLIYLFLFKRFELQGAFAIIDCEIQSIDEKVNECFSNRF